MARIRDTYEPNIWGEGNVKEITFDNGSKGTVRDTYVPNIWGEGNQKELKMDNGDKYIIRNTYVPNIWGEGNEQEIVKVDSGYKSSIPYSSKPVTVKTKILSVLELAAILIGLPVFTYVVLPWLFITFLD